MTKEDEKAWLIFVKDNQYAVDHSLMSYDGIKKIFLAGRASRDSEAEAIIRHREHQGHLIKRLCKIKGSE